MKIAWITRDFRPEAISDTPGRSGTWLNNLVDLIAKRTKYELDIYILSTKINRSEITRNNVTYIFTEETNNKNLRKRDSSLLKTLHSNKYDVIDVHGVEFTTSLLLKFYSGEAKVFYTLQGFPSNIASNYFVGLDQNMNRFLTIRNILRKDSVFKRQKMYADRGLVEQELLRSGKNFIGRTHWDKEMMLRVNKKAKYYHVDRILRESFYNYNGIWNIKDVDRFTLFVTQGHYPTKGLHIVIEALRVVKVKYPNCTLKIAGRGWYKGIKHLFLEGDYQKYCRDLLKKYCLTDSVFFLGSLSEFELVQQLKKSHISLLPSISENGSNSLAEAQMLGVPIIASDAGGTPTYVTHELDGLLFKSADSLHLAETIKNLFQDDTLASSLSISARVTAMKRHDKDRVLKQLINAYNNE